MPPTERKGRVHTSTVTVAVIEEGNFSLDINDNDLRIEWYSGTGAGGQNRNKVKCSCRITHLPTGEVATAQTRSRQNSLNLALADIQQRINNRIKSEVAAKVSADRRQQVGSGMRGDKIRTYRFQDDSVQDHNTGKNSRCTKVLKGNFDLLW